MREVIVLFQFVRMGDCFVVDFDSAISKRSFKISWGVVDHLFLENFENVVAYPSLFCSAFVCVEVWCYFSCSFFDCKAR